MGYPFRARDENSKTTAHPSVAHRFLVDCRARRLSRARARVETRRDESRRDVRPKNPRASFVLVPTRARSLTHVVRVSEDVAEKAIGVSRHLRRRASRRQSFWAPNARLRASSRSRRVRSRVRARVAPSSRAPCRSFVRSFVRSLARAFVRSFARSRSRSRSSPSVVVCRVRAASGKIEIPRLQSAPMETDESRSVDEILRFSN